MPRKTLTALLITLLCPPLQATAMTVHRCEDAEGRITYTTLSCPPGEALSRQNIYNPSVFKFEAILPGTNHQETSGIKSTPRDPVVIGQMNDKCANVLSAKERREAIINQRIVPGMSQQDVESALGKPDKVSIRNATTNYRYDSKKGRSAQIVFDEKGCVKGKSQTAKSPR
ncbi:MULTISPECIES: cell envelope protein SmpA [unclassified Pseudomonas]|uniref:cell envelope protein SmpA n=1 Tax=unclassified Pseudomonas TaxID=196821 RepID=UPI000CD26878|nr:MULTISPECIES: cell envelope protein SmpA [unclassified Pseudomonas]POA28604.1 cell envelope protein SmpA [Pseudomonas sp. GW456-R21]POA64509.1 cell envelope protein SmpA [Pseudomonas sp. GW460-R15]